MRAFEPEGELGTDPDSLPRFVEQAVRHVTVADNRETPVVESDQLGDDLGRTVFGRRRRWGSDPQSVDLAEPAPQGAQIGGAAFGDPLHFAGIASRP